MEDLVRSPYQRARPRVCWGGVVAGVFCVLALFDALLLLGSAIGLTAWGGRLTFERGLEFLASGLWVSVAAGAATFLGTLVGVRLSAIATRGVALLQGFVIWAVSFQVVVATLLLLSAVAAPEAIAGASPAIPAVPREQVAEAGVYAGWWLFGTVLLSAIGGLLGGIVAWPDTHRRAVSRPPRSVTVEPPPLTP